MSTTALPRGSAAYDFGYKSLGKVFVCFGHLLLRHARRLGVTRLAFVARDGDLLMRSTARLCESIGEVDRWALSYVSLSRQASFLPALESIDEAALAAAAAVCGERGSVAEALRYLGMPLAPLVPVFDRLSISPEGPAVAIDAMARLVADRQFQSCVRQESERQRTLLAAYLQQENIGAGAAALLVDIGWRGSILANLKAAFSPDSGFAAPPGAFLGLWSEGRPLPALPPGTVGLLADARCRNNVLEAAAWFAAFLLEAVCRANEGTTTGYEMRDGKVAPVLAGDSASRRAEAETAPMVTEIQRGILDFVDEHGAADCWLQASDDSLRRRAQRTLLRLACFPSKAELRVGAQLVHSEGHAPNWWSRLIEDRDLPSPWCPRRWLAGLASPWRTGYIRCTGGPLLAAAFLIFESLLLATSPGIRAAITRLAHQLSRASHPPVHRPS